MSPDNQNITPPFLHQGVKLKATNAVLEYIPHIPRKKKIAEALGRVNTHGEGIKDF